MKPWIVLEKSEGPGGEPFELVRRDDEYAIRANGRLLMSSRQHGSEEAMADVLRPSTGSPRHVLIGGLGLGYTLRATLDRLKPDDRVTVAEISSAVAEWNKGVLGQLAGQPLKDARVTLEIGDVGRLLRSGAGQYDAVLLDVDNGPEALSVAENERLYAAQGLGSLRDALRPKGIAVIWSAGQDRAFETRLVRAGFTVERRPVGARGQAGGATHTLFVARR